MRRLIVEPHGWPCTLAECPAGYFVYDDDLCLKTEYHGQLTTDDMEVYNEGGEVFWGGDPAQRSALIVQPVWVMWDEYEE